jgi:putative FmdB family regulatory protein
MEVNMPDYDYACKKCGKKFMITMSLNDHDNKKARCPKCGSGNVKQQISGFFAKTSKKS